MTPTPVPGALYVTPDGTAYRCRHYEPHPFRDGIRQSYSVLLPGGSSTMDDTLPDDAALVWHPT